MNLSKIYIYIVLIAVALIISVTALDLGRQTMTRGKFTEGEQETWKGKER